MNILFIILLLLDAIGLLIIAGIYLWVGYERLMERWEDKLLGPIDWED